MTGRKNGTRDKVIEHDVEIENIKGDIVEIKLAIRRMADTANRIYIAVLGCVLSVLGNMIIFWYKG